MDEDFTQAAASTRTVETIGPYKLLQRVGEGGMGEVWLAEQTQPIRRQVALKIIKAGMDTAQVVARFEAERQALAVMDHSAIARVFDAGATPQGRPYFAMEYVRGESITAYCDKQKLPLRERIDLFLQACDGVQHAHQKGIIHRDLKPSNILVAVQDDRAVPKIIDFGVAKATSRQLTDHTLHTEYGALIGTPEYMSPEQAEMTGLDIDTRTDVYALGVVLYELLTGALPFDSKTLRAKPLDEIRRTIREVDPPRPSTRVTTTSPMKNTADDRAVRAASASELRGDLDWITMRALEKDRTRRYGSASDLAADLRRHLDNLPVLASPPSTVYRVRKFARRHRMGVVSAAAMVALLVALAATMTVQARRIARERDRANRETAAAKAVAEFLVGLFKVSDPGEARGNTLTAREVLDTGAKQLTETLAGQPELQARLQETIATVYTNLGLYAAAEPLLARALATDTLVLGVHDLQTLSALNALATVTWFRGRFDEAERLYRQVVEQRTYSLGTTHRDTLKAQFDLASTLLMQERWTEFEKLATTILDAQRQSLGRDDPDTLESLNNLQNYYFQRKRYDEAEVIAKDVVDSRNRVLGEHWSTFLAMHNLGTIYMALDRLVEAEQLERRALAGQRRILGDTHRYTFSALLGLVRVYVEQRRFADAEAELLAAAATLERQSDVPADTRQRVASQLVTVYTSWGMPTKAAEWRAKLPKEVATKDTTSR